MNITIIIAYTIFIIIILINLIYMIGDTRRLHKDMNKLQVMDDHIKIDMEITQCFIKTLASIEQRLSVLEDKLKIDKEEK